MRKKYLIHVEYFQKINQKGNFSLKFMIKFAKPKIGNSTLLKIAKIFKTGNFVHGDFTKKFEKGLTRFFDLKNKQILTTASCTASMHLYYLSIGLKKMMK